MGVPNSFSDLKDDVDYVLRYFDDECVYYFTVGGIYQPLREILTIANKTGVRKHFAPRRLLLEDVVRTGMPWLR